MKTVILCNRLSRLTAILQHTSLPLCYISLTETAESISICNYLRQREGTTELPRAALLMEQRERFKQEYVEFLGRLNAGNHSIYWWAMPFTNKNPLATQLCRSTAYFLLIVALVRSSPGLLVVVTDNFELATQVEKWGKAEGVSTTNLLSRPLGWKNTVKRFTPGAVLSNIIKTFWIWGQSRHLRLPEGVTESRTVVVSLLQPHALAEPGVYRDVYFGKLVDHLLKGENNTLIFGLLGLGWKQGLSRVKSLYPAVPVVPVETYLSFRDLAECCIRSLMAYFSSPRSNGTASIGGLDVSHLVHQAINEARHSGNFFMNLRIYYCARALARNVRVGRCLYPYENRSWEKMLILGVRSSSPKSRMVGYQHASITESHTNFILGDGESEFLPLPDAIVTTGTVVKEWLERHGKYPDQLFKTGCALRQAQNDHIQLKQRRDPMKNVLVALATSTEEYINTLVFLEKSCAGSQNLELQVRAHPTIPLSTALDMAPLNGTDFFSPSSGSLADSLEWADVVLYASSTVSIEAVSQGIPAIYLDLGDFLDTDPMLGWNHLKWSVTDPSKLVDTIRCIESIPQNRFQELQEKGRAYTAAYLSPVTPGRLAAFLEA